MPWCPDCRTEYEAGRANCADCGADLVESLPSEGTDEEPVVVLEADSAIEAQVAEATLEAEGIPAFVQSPTFLIPGDNLVDDENPELDVLVPADRAEEATAVLHAPSLSEEELTTLEESEGSAAPEETEGA